MIIRSMYLINQRSTSSVNMASKPAGLKHVFYVCTALITTEITLRGLPNRVGTDRIPLRLLPKIRLPNIYNQHVARFQGGRRLPYIGPGFVECRFLQPRRIHKAEATDNDNNNNNKYVLKNALYMNIDFQ